MRLYICINMMNNLVNQLDALLLVKLINNKLIVVYLRWSWVKKSYPSQLLEQILYY